MRRKFKLKKWVVITFILICLCGVIYYSYEIIILKLHSNDNDKIQEKLEDNITIIDSKEEQEVKYNVNFKSLKETNKDTIAYIKVNNTNIDYVVVKGDDNIYYLKHNFEKKFSVAGWIFADYRNKFDGTDKNIVIYGHNSIGESMFGTLKNVLNKEWYQNIENHQVILSTESGTYYYKVFSTYSIAPEDYYINTNFNNDTEFSNFIKKLKSRSVYDYRIDVSGEDKILTLSSCMNDGKKRVVLHAKLIENNEE